jgi:hypothetical protein
VSTSFSNLVWSANYAERAVDTRKNHETLNRTFRHPSRRYRARRGDRVPANGEVRITYDRMGGVVTTPDSFIGSALIEKWFGCCPYGPKFTVTVLEQVWVPASHTLYMKLAWPVVPVESSYKPSFGVVAITTPSR